jgi:hypothetical protein
LPDACFQGVKEYGINGFLPKGSPPIIPNITFLVPDNVVIDEAFLGDNGYKGIGYLFNLYAKENDKTILLSSTYMFGTSYQDDLPRRQFNIHSGLLKLSCSIE